MRPGGQSEAPEENQLVNKYFVNRSVCSDKTSSHQFPRGLESSTDLSDESEGSFCKIYLMI
jgi:hypothetical protein